MKVNIVMLHHGRIRLASQAIKSLERSTRGIDVNLTLVMDGPDVGLERKIEIDHSVLWVSPEVNVTGRLRNLGIYWSDKHFGRGDYLYLSDDDCFFTPGWLETLIDTIEDPRIYPIVKMIGGWNHPYLQPKWKSSPWDDKGGLMVATHDALAGASQLMRWETWDKFGPLDAHAKGVGQSEDWKFSQSIIQSGGDTGSVYPRVVLNCGITNSFGEASPGADVMHEELVEAKKIYKDLQWE